MYECYLGGILMPITPAKFSVKIKGKNSTVTLLNGNEINILKSPGLSELTVPLVFPMLSSDKPADYYIELLGKLKTEKKPTQFKLLRSTPDGIPLFDTDMKVSVEDYTLSEDATKGLDISVDVKLKQYRDYGTKTAVVEEVPASAGTTASSDTNNSSSATDSAEKSTSVTVTKDRDSSTAPSATTYTVQRGDTLWAIAKKYLKDGSKYNLILEANKDVISAPHLIRVGDVLTIPQV